MWLFGAMIFVLGAGMGLVMQTIVLAVQNAVDPHELGTATSANNFFREIGAAVGTAVFSTIFTTALTSKLTDVFADAPAGSADPSASLTPEFVQTLPEPYKSGVIDAFASTLAPSFWYFVPLILVGFVLALFLREVKLSGVAGMVARGEALAADGSGASGPGAVVVDELTASADEMLPTQRPAADDVVRRYPGAVTSDAPAVRRKRPAKPQFAQTMLILEAFCVFFATLVAYGLSAGDTLIASTGMGVGDRRRPHARADRAVGVRRAPGRVRRRLGRAGLGRRRRARAAVGGAGDGARRRGRLHRAVGVSLRLGGRIDRERAEYDAAHPGEVGP